MDLKLLIDGIVRQTTVLIAQLSTASGVRAPLAHVADQIFLELAREIEAQGIKRQVVADMFGMALRSYTKKMTRLTESGSVRDRTLWEAVLEFICEHNPPRERVLGRFSADGEREVAAVLQDLKRSGLIYVTGAGNDSIYGVTSDDVRTAIRRRHDADALANLIWLQIFRSGKCTRDQILAEFEADQSLVNEALEQLFASGRLERDEHAIWARNFVVPFGARQGWESAVLDHFRTVTTAIAAKVAKGASAAPDDRVGGSTFSFTVHPNHPQRERVFRLLSKLRTEVQELWNEVSTYNQAHPPPPDEGVKVSFYLGQTVEAEDREHE